MCGVLSDVDVCRAQAENEHFPPSASKVCGFRSIESDGGGDGYREATAQHWLSSLYAWGEQISFRRAANAKNCRQYIASLTTCQECRSGKVMRGHFSGTSLEGEELSAR